MKRLFVALCAAAALGGAVSTASADPRYHTPSVDPRYEWSHERAPRYSYRYERYRRVCQTEYHQKAAYDAYGRVRYVSVPVQVCENVLVSR